MTKVNCIICGDEFVKERNQKTCSDKCSAIRKKQYNKKFGEKYYEKVNKADTEEKECVVCGETFKGNGREKICSDACRDERKNQYIIKHRAKEEVITCDVCGKDFERKHKETVCSDRCKIERRKLYQQRYYENVVLPKRQAEQQEQQ